MRAMHAPSVAQRWPRRPTVRGRLRRRCKGRPRPTGDNRAVLVEVGAQSVARVCQQALCAEPHVGARVDIGLGVGRLFARVRTSGEVREIHDERACGRRQGGSEQGDV